MMTKSFTFLCDTTTHSTINIDVGVVIWIESVSEKRCAAVKWEIGKKYKELYVAFVRVGP